MSTVGLQPRDFNFLSSSAVNKANELHEQGFSCSQAVFGAYCERFGVDKEQGLKLACGLGGGLGRLGGRCGAVTGACLLIGLKHGMAIPGDTGAKNKTYEVVREFVARFEERQKSSVCSELTGVELLIADQAALERIKPICDDAIRDAVTIVGEMLGLL